MVDESNYTPEVPRKIDTVTVRVNCLDSCAQTYVDVWIVIKPRRSEVQALGRHFTGEKFFGQRRSLIRQIRLFANEHNIAREFLLFERCDGLTRGMTGANDDCSFTHICQQLLCEVCGQRRTNPFIHDRADKSRRASVRVTLRLYMTALNCEPCR